MTDRLRDRIITLARYGYTTAEIADHLGCSARTVQRHRSAAGVGTLKVPNLSADEVARAAELLDDGASYRETARTLGRGVSQIIARFPGRGWTRDQINEYRVMKKQLEAL